MAGKLEGKKCLITGGSSGIGKATAALFLKEGAYVAITGTSTSKLDDAVKEIGTGHEGRLVPIQLDVTSVAAIETAMGKVESEFGKLDVLFVNAGMSSMPNKIEKVPEGDYDATMQTTFKGAFFTLQKAIPILNDGGAVVFNASIAGHMGQAESGMSVYGAAKAAVLSLTRNAAIELAPRKVRVNAVSPGPIETPFIGRMNLLPEQVDEFTKKLTEKVPLHRFGTADEVAKASLFLSAGDDAGYVNGAELVVDGGILARGGF